MLDQNTTTVLTTLITVFGTLGGVVLGVVLSNRYAARQEKAKRNTAIIEEVYALLIDINVRITDNIHKKRHCKDGIEDKVNRIQTLICLYLPSLVKKFAELDDSLTRLSREANGTQHANNPPGVRKIVSESSETYKNFRQKLLEVETALEILVK